MKSLPSTARGQFPRTTFRIAPRSGLVLLDVVVSAAISAVLFAGMAASVFIAMRAGDSSIGPSSRSYNGAAAVQTITRELRHATAFSSTYSNATRIEFTIPDQTGDGSAETVRYSWSGVAGDPIYRTFNGGAAEELVAGVHSFNLKYHTKTVPPDPILTEGNETQLLDQSGSMFLSLWQDISTSGWIGVHVAPTFGSNVVSWRITRIQAYLDATSSDHGITVAQVRKADSTKKPTDMLVGQAIASEVWLTGAWYTFAFDNAAGLSPSDGACILITSGNGTSEIACTARYTIFTNTPATTFLSTSDGGSTWGTSTTNDLWMRVWGRATTQSAGSGATRYYRTGVEVTVRVGSDTRATVTSTVETVNRPEVAAP